MKRTTTLLLLALTSLTYGCSSTSRCVLQLTSEPPGAEVYLSRHGDRAYRGDFGVVGGEVKSDELVEEFRYVGTTPLEYTTQLEETESGGRFMGVGASVVLRYDEGFLRVQKKGYEVAERQMLIRDGEVTVHVELLPTPETAAVLPR